MESWNTFTYNYAKTQQSVRILALPCARLQHPTALHTNYGERCPAPLQRVRSTVRTTYPGRNSVADIASQKRIVEDVELPCTRITWIWCRPMRPGARSRRRRMYICVLRGESYTGHCIKTMRSRRPRPIQGILLDYRMTNAHRVGLGGTPCL